MALQQGRTRVRVCSRRGAIVAASLAWFAMAWFLMVGAPSRAQPANPPAAPGQIQPPAAPIPARPPAGPIASTPAEPNESVPPPSRAQPPGTPFAELFAGLAGRVVGVVVNISTQAAPPAAKTGPDTAPNSPGSTLDEVFRDFFADKSGPGGPGPRIASLGSGFVIDPSGLIVTNNHVIANAEQITVTLSDDTVLQAQVIGRDAVTDLALLKVDAKTPLPAATWGDSNKARVGDWVLAIGSPFGLQSTVTAGIISATDRGGVGRQFQHFLQTDAAINPGNSGGPLVDLAGQVIGINTAIMTGGRGYEGVGFALPSKVAVGVYNQIIERGKVIRGSIGVTFTEEQSKNPIVLHELGASYGLVLQSVEAGGPADRAGVKAGDVITSVNGLAVRSGSDLVNPIADTPIGAKVQVTYLRSHQEHEATLVVEDRAKLFPDRAGDDDTDQKLEPRGAVPAGLGLRVEELKPDKAHRAYFQDQRGVLVIDVAPASFAEDIGFFRGDLIAEINQMPVTSVGEYNAALSSLKPGQQVVFKTLRHDESQRVLTVYLAGLAPAARE